MPRGVPVAPLSLAALSSLPRECATSAKCLLAAPRKSAASKPTWSYPSTEPLSLSQLSERSLNLPKLRWGPAARRSAPPPKRQKAAWGRQLHGAAVGLPTLRWSQEAFAARDPYWRRLRGRGSDRL
eukprot:6964082-Prymnesium_polylepis.1